MNEKKVTAMTSLLIEINEIIEMTSSIPRMDLETKGFIEGLNKARKLIEQKHMRNETEQMHNCFDEGYFNGAELIEYTADQYLNDNYQEKNNILI